MFSSPLFQKLFKKTALKRTIFFLIADSILFSLVLYFSFLLRFDGEIPAYYLEDFYLYIPIFVSVKLAIYYYYRIYRFSWSYVGLYELLKLFNVQTLSSLIIGVLVLGLAYEEPFRGFPRSILLLDYAFSLLAAGGLRIAKRVYLLLLSRPQVEQKRTLIIGAGNAGEQLVRDMKRTKDSLYNPVAFIDDDPAKKRVSLHGVEVMGRRKDIPWVVEKMGIELAVIAMPSVPSKEIRDIVSYLHRARINDIRIIPGTKEIISRNISILDIKRIELEDLLRREPVEIRYTQVESELYRRRVLVTGAGGSIGSELARQICQFHPELLLLVDFNETELFYIGRELKERYPDISLQPILGDILDRYKMRAIFNDYLPQVVYHAAAYKHVPVIEDFPEEGVRVNIVGTKIISELAQRHGVDKFIFISTDKVVNPTSVMGASKRVAEMIITNLNHRQGTQFIAVRFGNVLGSRGSVIPIFQEQIRKGGPVTITHPDMQRYFMTIPEAVLLVLQAGAMGKGGEVFVLDMGEPVRIYDIACELIRLSGMEPEKDIPIVFTGIRPGEKLFEEVLTAEEGVEPTAHPKIFKARIKQPLEQELLDMKINELENLVQLQDSRGIVRLLQEIVPTYRPNRPDD